MSADEKGLFVKSTGGKTGGVTICTQQEQGGKFTRESRTSFTHFVGEMSRKVLAPACLATSRFALSNREGVFQVVLKTFLWD